MNDKLNPRQASRFAFLLKQKRNIYNVEDICTYFAFPTDIILGSRA